MESGKRSVPDRPQRAEYMRLKSRLASIASGLRLLPFSGGTQSTFMIIGVEGLDSKILEVWSVWEQHYGHCGGPRRSFMRTPANVPLYHNANRGEYCEGGSDVP